MSGQEARTQRLVPQQVSLRAFDPGLLLIALLVLLAVSPLFPPGLPNIADAPIHLFRTLEMVSVWADGILYSRWAPNLAFGYGYPLFDFAPPLPYFIAGTFFSLGFSLETSIKLLAVVCMACYGFGMYLFTRNILGKRGALLAAAAFLFTPFRFREILLYGGNYPQILAIGLFPWVFWAFERIIRDGRQRYAVAGTVCFGALILSHNFHAFIFTPLLIIYIVLFSFISGPRNLVAQSSNHPSSAFRSGPVVVWLPVVALLLGLVLTAFFWAPALYDLQYTAAQADYYLTRSDFRLRLLTLGDLLAWPSTLDSRADNPDVPFSLGVVVIVLAVMGIVYLALVSLHVPKRVSGERQREILHLLFFLLVLLGASFMMLRPAALLWETLPFLPYAEFPWRLMGMANLGAAFLAGGSVRLLEWGAEQRRGQSHLADSFLIASVLALILGVAVFLYPAKPFLHWGTPTLSDYIHYEGISQNVGTTGLAEYLPRWAQEIPASSPLVGRLREGKEVEKLDRSSLPTGVGAVELTHNAVTDRYHFSSEESFRANFFAFYFPGWRAFLDGKPIPIHITAPLGLIVVDVPAGEHELLLRFGETPFRLIMDLVSMAALLGLVLWLVKDRMRERVSQHTERHGAERGIRSQSVSAGSVWTGSGRIVLALLLAGLIVGKVTLVDPRTNWFRQKSPPGQILGVQHPMNVRLEDNVVFLGYDIVGEGSPHAGELLHVRLYWQATGPLEGDYVSFIHLDAPPDNATFATADNYVPGDPQAQIDVPSSFWNPELYVRDEHRLVVPDDIPPIAYSLRAGLYERETGQRLPISQGQFEGLSEDTLLLQQVHVLPDQGRPLLAARSGEKYLVGETIELLGHRMGGDALEGGTVQPGQTIAVTLYWRTQAPVEGDYTVFVHLLDGAGQIRGQHDGQPVSGRYPTSNWLPHQVVEDRSFLTLEPDLLPGGYRIAVGMYELESGQRLAVKGKSGDVPSNAILLEPTLQVGVGHQ